jgi:hypothetical protein
MTPKFESESRSCKKSQCLEEWKLISMNNWQNNNFQFVPIVIRSQTWLIQFPTEKSITSQEFQHFEEYKSISMNNCQNTSHLSVLIWICPETLLFQGIHKTESIPCRSLWCPLGYSLNGTLRNRQQTANHPSRTHLNRLEGETDQQLLFPSDLGLHSKQITKVSDYMTILRSVRLSIEFHSWPLAMFASIQQPIQKLSSKFP